MNKILMAALAAFALSAPALHAQKTDARMDFDLPFSMQYPEKHKSTGGRTSIDLGNICVGPLFTRSAFPYDFNPSKSCEISIFGTSKGKIAPGFQYALGVGVDWKNFAITNGNILHDSPAGPVTEFYRGDISSRPISKLKVFSVTFPVLFSVNIVNGFGFSFGPIINLNTSAWIKNKYMVEGQLNKDRIRTPYTNLLTVDIMAQINIKSISLFAKYSPMSILDKAYWPEFEHFSIGIAL